MTPRYMVDRVVAGRRLRLPTLARTVEDAVRFESYWKDSGLFHHTLYPGPSVAWHYME